MRPFALEAVYEYVKMKPDDVVTVEPAKDLTQDQFTVHPVNIASRENKNSLNIDNQEKPVTPLITEAGQKVLEIVGDEAVIKFKDYGGVPVEEAVANANITIGAKNDMVAESINESDYNVELGVYHENEMSNQPTLSPKPMKKSFKNKRKQGNKTFRKSFLGIPQQESIDNPPQEKGVEVDKEEDPYDDLGSVASDTESALSNTEGDVNNKQPSESNAKDASEAWENNSETPDVTIELVDSTATLDASTDDEGGANMTIDDFLGETETIANDLVGEDDEIFNNLITRASRQTWEEVEGMGDPMIPPPLLLQENLRY